jgi:hypothetical protein
LGKEQVYRDNLGVKGIDPEGVPIARGLCPAGKRHTDKRVLLTLAEFEERLRLVFQMNSPSV